MYINSTNLPVEGEIKPELTPPTEKPGTIDKDSGLPIPDGATLILKSPYYPEWKYSYKKALPNGAYVETVIVGQIYNVIPSVTMYGKDEAAIDL